MSKLFEKYKNSKYFDIVNSNKNKENLKFKYQNDNNNNNNADKTSIDVNKQFTEVVVKPYGNILDHHSSMGNIKINPTKAIIDLFSTIKNKVKYFVVSSNKETQVPFISNFKTISLESSQIATIIPFVSNNILSTQNIIEIISFNTNPLLHSPVAETNIFETQDIINNVSYDNIVKFETDSILNTGKLPTLNNMRVSSVLDFKQDIVVNDFISILESHIALNLLSKIPTSVNFFNDEHATGFNIFSEFGNTAFNLEKISSVPLMPGTPEKPIEIISLMPPTPPKDVVNVPLMPMTPTKPIAELVPMDPTPIKIGVDVPLMPDPLTKPISDLNPPAITLEKPVPTIVLMPGTPEKPIPELTISNFIIDKDATGFTINQLPFVSDFKMVNRRDKERSDVKEGRVNLLNIYNNSPNTIYNKTNVDDIPVPVNFIIDTDATGFTINQRFQVSDFRMVNRRDRGVINIKERIPLVNIFNDSDKNINYGPIYNGNVIVPGIIGNVSNLLIKYDNEDMNIPSYVNFFNDKESYTRGFTLNRIPRGETEYQFDDYYNDRKNDRNKLAKFDFNSNDFHGVLDQYIAYFGKYPPIEDVNFSTIIEWGYNQIVKVPEARNIINKGFQTPMISIGGGGKLTIPPYNNPNDKIPLWANSHISTLEKTGNKIISGFLSDTVIDIISGTGLVSGVSLDKMKDTPLAFHVYAGDIYYSMQNLQTISSNYLDSREVIPYSERISNRGSASEVGGILGNLVSNAVAVVPDLISYGASQISKLITDAIPFIGSSALDADKFLMIRHIMEGTKYTKSKAFYDSNASIYRQQSSYTNPELLGNNAFNLYTEENKFDMKPNAPTEFSNISSVSPIGLAKQGVIDSLASPNLITGERDNSKIYKSININYDTSSNKNNFTEDVNNDNNVEIARTSEDSIESSYTRILRKKLNDTGKSSIVDNGIPDIKFNQYRDAKNKADISSNEEYEDTDLINFYFQTVSNDHVIPFRAILTNINDGTTANWASHEYMGRPDKFWIYQGFDRKISLSFDVFINSKTEFESSWKKINYLQGLCYPKDYPKEVTYTPSILKINVGNLFEDIYVILNDVSYTFDSKTIWEIERGHQLPQYIQISVSFQVLYSDVPKLGNKFVANKQEWMDYGDLLGNNRGTTLNNTSLNSNTQIGQENSNDSLPTLESDKRL